MNRPSEAPDFDVMLEPSEDSLLDEIFFNFPLLKSPGQKISGTLVDRTLSKDCVSVALLGKRSADAMGEIHPPDPEVYLNTSEPFCVCCVGLQGAGKSHTLSVLLENCLLSLPRSADRPLVRLQQPMAAMVLHYDDNISCVCEAIGLTDISPALLHCKQAHALPKENMTILVSPSYYLARKVSSSICRNSYLVNRFI